MKDVLFISWTSRDNVSKLIGEAFYDFFQSLFPDELDIFFSKKTAGSSSDGWFVDFKTTLKRTKFALFILSQEAVNSEWIGYELGAISTNDVSCKTQKRIFSIQFDDKLIKRNSPFSVFQIMDFSKENMYVFFTSICEEYNICDRDDMFKTEWDNLVSKCTDILDKQHS